MIDPRDADPLTYDETADMCPNCVTPWKCNGPHLAELTVNGSRWMFERERAFYDQRSEPARWPLFVAVLIVVAAAVFVAQVAASRSGQGSTSVLRVRPAVEDTPAQAGTLQGGTDGVRPVRRVPERDVRSVRMVPVLREPALALPDTSTSVQGTASWYCGGGSACTRGYPPGTLAGAAGPALRVGDWRGRIVKVCNAGSDRKTLCVRVQLVDWCACPRRVIDLYRAAFSRLASPSRGVLRVSVTWGGSTVVLPPTDTR